MLLLRHQKTKYISLLKGCELNAFLINIQNPLIQIKLMLIYSHNTRGYFVTNLGVT